MAYTFNTQDQATFKVPPTEQSGTLSIPGVNAKSTDADMICDGVASLMSVASLTGSFDLAERTVKESVDIQQEP